jgi:hypothetical protein
MGGKEVWGEMKLVEYSIILNITESLFKSASILSKSKLFFR